MLVYIHVKAVGAELCWLNVVPGSERTFTDPPPCVGPESTRTSLLPVL
jgi:hypothetical protein